MAHTIHMTGETWSVPIHHSQSLTKGKNFKNIQAARKVTIQNAYKKI